MDIVHFFDDFDMLNSLVFNNSFIRSIRIIVLATFSFSLQSFSAGGYFEKINENSSLNSNYIDYIYQDSYGYIWICTEFGINYYDGYNVYNVIIPSNKATVGSPPYVRDMVEDADKNIWIATSAGLLVYNLPSQKLSWASFNKEMTADATNVLQVNLDANHNLYVLTDTHFYRYSKADKALINIDIEDFQNYHFNRMVVESDGTCWLTNNIEIVRYNQQKKTITNYKNQPEDGCSIGSFNINDLFIDSKQQVWILLSSGLNKYVPESNCFERYEGIGGILDLAEDLNGIFWLATWEDGLFRFDPTTGVFSKPANAFNDENTSASNSIRDVFVDADNNVWIGTNGDGVSLYNDRYWQFKHYKYSNGNPNSLNSNKIRSFYETESSIWVGTDNNGINKISKETGKIEYLLSHSEGGQKRDNSIVISICEYPKNQLWIGTVGGLHRMKVDDKQYELQKLDCFDNGVSQVWTIIPGNEGVLWLGTLNGLVKYNQYTNKAVLFSHDPNNPNSISNNGIPAICKKDTNFIWLGSKNGLNLLNTQTNEIKHYYKNLQLPNSLAGNSINHIDYTTNGDLWISTNTGLSKYNPTNDDFSTISNNEWPSQIIFGILEDKNHNLWSTTHHGIVHFKPNGEIIKVYDVNDGLQSNQFLAGAFYKDKNGQFFVGGTNGFNSFDPSNIASNTITPRTLITSLYINNKEAKVGEEGSPLKNSIRDTRKLVLKYNQHTFNLNFTAINYIHTEKNKYAYKLEGFDKEWVYCNNRRTAYYTNIPHGKYIFKVKASNNDGVWNENGQQLDLEILPPIWATFWAKIVYFLIPLILLYFFRMYSIIGVEIKNKLKLDQLEKEKVKEVYDLKMRFFMNISHEFRTPLTLIIDPIENALNQLPSDSALKKTLVLSHKNAVRMLNLVNQLLDFRKIETGNTHLNVSNNEVVNFIKDLVNSFSDKAEKKRIHLEVKASPEQIMVWFDKEKMEKIVLNLLSNAFKHTPDAGRITVLISLSEMDIKKTERSLMVFPRKEKKERRSCILIEVEDTGSGIAPDEINHIFNRFYQVKEQQNNINKGVGLGLSLVKSLVELHSGEIKVSSIENIGSRFSVLLPMGNKHFKQDEISGTTNAETLTEKQIDLTLLSDEDEVNDKHENNEASNQKIILFVDDNPEITSYVKDNLSKTYRILIGHNGEEGITLALKYIPDIIITDVMMPVMDGIEFTRHIKSNKITSHIPLIILSARTANETKVEGYVEGASDYITKPFSMNLLELKIKNVLADRIVLQEKIKQSLFTSSVEINYDSADEKFVHELHHLVEKNISEPEFDVDLIVNELSISRSQLYRKLKSLTGQSVKEFVRNIRLNTAAKLLQKGDLRVVEVMDMVGINNRSYFIKCFKQQFGVNPSEYGKNKQA
ncbi:MAG: two-component regulator propeller domain-containing protein [Prolixibacteraceae bacterium]